MAGGEQIEDFASVAMMRLVSAGLARQGIPGPAIPHRGARVPRVEKRDLLERILSAHGARAVLAIADAAPHMPPEPVVQALTLARDFEDLLRRWHRLERFSHGRHAVLAEPVGTGRFRLAHRARDAGPPPSAAESLLVIGVLAVLAEMATSGNVALATETGGTWRKDGAWLADAGQGFTGAVLLSVAPPDTAAPPEVARATGAAADPFDRLRERLAEDPLRRWSLAAIASDTRMSARTLQRRLAARSMSFSRLVADARLQVAASHLCDPNGPSLAEIGFLAGYADQAHFARSFSRAVGTTPSAFRSDFRV